MRGAKGLIGVVVLVLNLAGPLSAALPESPTAEELAADPQVRSLFVELFTRDGLPLDERERAAFIIREADGTYGMVLWPSCEKPRTAKFRGAVPSTAVAVVHTHPIRFPKGSLTDAKQAKRLQLPFYVLTIRSIHYVEPSNGRNIEVHRGPWLKVLRTSREPSSADMTLSRRQ